jgi:hypothetical protein
MSSKPFLSVAQHSPAASGNLSSIRSVTITAITLLALFPKASIARTFYDAVKNFSIKANPNGPWSYLSAVPLPYKANSIMGVKGLPYWYSNLQGCCENAYVVRNKTGAPADILTIVAPIDHLWFDPQGNANVIVRFQAPKAGVYVFAGDFLGIDTDQVSHPVSISENAVTIFSGTISSYGQSLPYKLKMTLSVGDTIDFICATGARLNDLSTGLAVKISGP